MEREAELEKFLQTYNIQTTKKKRKKLLEMSEGSFQVFTIGVEIAHCCKELNLEKAYSCYLKSKELKLTLTSNMMTNLLSLASGLGELGNGNLQVRPTPPPQDISKALEIFSDMKANKINLTEAAYSSIIRCCCDHSHLQQALSIYEEMKTVEISPKLRTITSLLSAFSEEKVEDSNYSDPLTRCNICHNLFQEGFETYHILYSEKEYYYLLRICHISRQHSLFIDYLQLLMEELMLLSHQTTLDLIQEHYQIFSTESDDHYESITSSISKEGVVEANGERLKSIDLSEEIQQDLLQKIQSFAVNRDPNFKHKLNNKIKDSMLYHSSQKLSTTPASLSSVEPSTTTTSTSDITQTSVTAETEQSKQTQSRRPSRGKDKRENQTQEDRLKTWNQFETFLEEKHQQLQENKETSQSISALSREGAKRNKKKLIIVDGANIGYYKQNYPGAPLYVNYHQINRLIEQLTRYHDYFPIIILHARHLHPAIDARKSPEEYEQVHAILGAWRKAGYLYATPKGFNDDWFWMFATIKYQCYIITNDDMRDHHFQLLSPRYFLRWRERHRVNYEISHYCQYNEVKKRNEFHIARITFHWPLVYSYRIQYVKSERYEGYYFPPLQQEPVMPIKADSNDIEGGDSDDDTENVTDMRKPEEMSNEVDDKKNYGDEMENESRLDRSDRPWFCIFRAITATEENIEGERRKRGRSQVDNTDGNLTNVEDDRKNDDPLIEKDFKLMKR